MKIIAVVSFTLFFLVLIATAALWKSHFAGSLSGEYHKDVPINRPTSEVDKWVTEKSDAKPDEDLWVELQEKADRYVVIVHTPGLEISEIDVKVVGKQLTIFFKVRNAANLADSSDTDFKYLSRYMGQFSKTMTLPGHVAVEKVFSDFKNDVLTVDLPKK